MTWTVLGSSGFIGREIVRQLRQRGETVLTPTRAELDLLGDAGNVIYAIGMTADFRQHLFETVDAHVIVLRKLLQTLRFTSFLYLSSTRVYQGCDAEVVDEDSRLSLWPDRDAVYNGSKLLGEALCLAQSNSAVRVARLSNVYAVDQTDHSFLGMVLRDAVQGQARIQQSPQMHKDYIDREQAVYWLLQIAERGKQRLYNVSSGELVSHAQIAAALNACAPECCRIVGTENAMHSPRISNARVRDEFPAALPSLIEQLPLLYTAAQHRYRSGALP